MSTSFVATFLVLCALSNLCAQPRLSNAERYYALGNTLYDSGNYQSAADTLKKAITLFHELNNIEGEIKASNLYAENLANTGACDLALSVLKQTLELGEANRVNDSFVAETYYYTGKALGGCARKFDEAMKYFQRSMALKRKLYGETIEIANDYNFIGYMLDAKGRYDSALLFLNKAFDIRSKELSKDDVELGNTLFNLAKVYENKSEIIRALSLQKDALKIRIKRLGQRHPLVSNSLHSTGAIYQKLGDLEQALQYFEQALEIRKKTLGNDHPNVAASYYTIGNLHGNLLNYYEAIQYVTEGNRILEKRFPNGNDILPTYYAQLGKFYGTVQDVANAQNYLVKSLRTGEKLLREDHPYLAIIYNLHGEYYTGQLDYVKATHYFTKAKTIFQIANGVGSLREADVIGRLAFVSSKLGNYDAADTLYAQAIAMLVDKVGDQNSRVANLFLERGQSFFKRGLIVPALTDYQNAFSSLAINFEATSMLDSNPMPAMVDNKPLAVKIATGKAMAFSRKYAETKNQTDLSSSLSAYLFAMELLEEVHKAYQLETVKQTWQSETLPVFHRAIEIAFQLYSLSKNKEYIETAFRIASNGKSWLLKDRLDDAEAKFMAEIPDDIMNKERDLRIQLTFYQNALFKARKGGNNASASEYQSQLFTLEQESSALNKTIEQTYPTYFQLRYANNNVILNTLQQKLADDALLLEYLVSDSALYTIAIGKNSTNFYRESSKTQVDQAYKNYLKSLTDPAYVLNARVDSDQLYRQSGSALFDILLKPALADQQEIKELIIVPDNFLSNLNFSTLLIDDSTQGADFLNMPFLCRKYTVSYAYSSSLFVNQGVKEKSSQHRFAGFAPSYSQDKYSSLDTTLHLIASQMLRAGNLALPGAASEVQWISEFMNGQSWLNETATESNFKLNARNYDILHLAMHSLINLDAPDNSELLFYRNDGGQEDGYLRISEIYNMKLNASLVVLSSCSSGVGPIQQGEGAITLARAFSYAGCKSVVMSLWKVPDHVTNAIMKTFYLELNEGRSKDEALRNAQLKFLNETQDPTLRHPFFWAGFVIIGDTRPLPTSFAYTNYLIAMLVALALVFAILKRKRLLFFKNS